MELFDLARTIEQSNQTTRSELGQIRQEMQRLTASAGQTSPANLSLERAAFNIAMSMKEAAEKLKLALIWAAAILSLGTVAMFSFLLVVLLGRGV